MATQLRLHDCRSATDLGLRYKHDALGRMISKTDPLPAGSPAADRAAHTTSYEYDDAGRLTAVLLPEVQIDDPETITADLITVRPRYEYTYDANGNQTRIVTNAYQRPDGTGVRNVYLRKSESDGADVVATSTDPASKDAETTTTLMAYDYLNRLTSRTLPLGVATDTNDADFVETSVYGQTPLIALANRASSVSADQLAYSVDFEGHVTAYKYDNSDTGGGRLVQKSYYETLGVYANGSGQASRTIGYTYDAFGRQHTVTDSVAGPTTYGYDDQGRQNLVESPQGTIHYEYNDLGQLTRTYTGNAESAAGVRANVASDGIAITDTSYVYNPLGQLWKVELYAANDQPFKHVGGNATPEITTYTYGVLGSLDTEMLPNGVISDYDYDAMGHVLTLTHYGPDLTPNDLSDNPKLEQFEYAYDADGNRSSSVETVWQSGIPSVTDVAWTYDNLNRLTEEAWDGPGTANDYVATYGFDLVGNRLEKATDTDGDTQADEVIAYTYDANDRLLTEDRAVGGVNVQDTAYEYGSGNCGTQQTLKTVTDVASSQVTEETAYAYDVRGQLDTVTIEKRTIVGGSALYSSGHQEVYFYDASGTRVSIAIAEDTDLDHDFGDETGTTTSYLYDGQNCSRYTQVVEEHGAGGAVQATYAYGLDLISQNRNSGNSSATSFYLHDAHGSVRILSDSIGEVTDTYTYDAYGTLTSSTGTTPNTYLYSGERTDLATNLQPLGSGTRYYACSSGIFLSKDPAGMDLYTPITSHSYLYGAANPVMYSDPTGMFFDMISLLTSLTIRGMEEGQEGVKVAPALSFARSLNMAMKFYNGVSSAWDTLSTLADFTKLADLSGAERAAFKAGLAGLSSMGLHVKLPTIRIPVPVSLVNKIKRKVGPMWATPPMQQLMGAAIGALATTMLGWQTTSISASYSGVDAIMKVPSLGVFAVVEAKGGSGKLGMTADGPQMYDRWVGSRIRKALGENPNAADYGQLKSQQNGPLLAAVFSTDLTGGSPYLAVRAQTYRGITSWGAPFE